MRDPIDFPIMGCGYCDNPDLGRRSAESASKNFPPNACFIPEICYGYVSRQCTR